MSLVEWIADELHASPCRYGTVADNISCYCHNRQCVTSKCPIWKRYGGKDLSKWHNKGDWNDATWDGGCRFFKEAKE